MAPNRVLVTGATGFVGAHTVAALRAAGLEVRLLVRSPARVAPALDPLGVTDVDFVVGDVNEPASVRDAVKGCDAAVHAAAVVTFERSRAEEAARVNADGVRTVLGAALDAGCDPVVFVSSLAVLDPSAGPVLGPQTPLNPSQGVYAGSKSAGERVARELHQQGAPVVITYPGGVWGPHDPHLGEQTRATAWLLWLPVLPNTPGGYPIVDVRDLGAIHAAALTGDGGPRRYLAVAGLLSGRELADVLAKVTGRSTRSVPAPASAMRAMGTIGDRLNRVLPWALPFTAEGMQTLVSGVPADCSSTVAELGVRFRPIEETVADTVRWLADAGHVPRRLAGRLGAGASLRRT